MVRHSSQDALTDSQFEDLFDAAKGLRSPFDAEACFILICGGRLGMRAGEIAHVKEHWIDWDKNLLEIPRHEPCDCGYCRKQAVQATEHNPELCIDIAMHERWNPKTPTSARAIPFDFNARVHSVVKCFFDEFDEYPHSRVSINRRVNRVAENAGVPKDAIYPHALRATAATWHAYKGLTAVPLQSMMGWRQISTAQKYIRLSGGATADALRDVHSD